MKILIFLLALTYAIHAQAQQTRIVDVPHSGSISWTNETTNAYCRIEWNVNLEDAWMPLPSIQATSCLVTVDLGLWDRFGLDYGADSLAWRWPGFARRFQGHFFRIVSSLYPLEPPIITNYVAISNASTGVLLNIRLHENPTFNTSVAVTNYARLLPSHVTPDHTITARSTWLEELDMSDVIGPVQTNLPGWFITWEQDGVQRHCGTTLVPIGPQDEKHRVTVTVYSNRFETYYDWLGPGASIDYSRLPTR